MDIKKQACITTTVEITATTTEVAQDNTKSRRYTTTEITDKHKVTNNNIENAVICTKDEQQKQQLINYYNQQYPVSQIVKLDQYNDLTDNDLLNIITCNQPGNLEVATGRLFNDEPLLLIIDLTKMSSGEIARLNDLLSIPATHNSKNISNNVKLAIIIDENMLTPGVNKPSADLWRRLAKFNFYKPTDILPSSRIASLKQTNNSLLNQQLLAEQIKVATKPTSVAATATVINFATNNNWQQLLFGTLTLDAKGKVYFKDGYFANNTNNQLVLQDAPWEDTEFIDALATALRQSGFRANGRWINLPKNLQLTKSFTSEQQLTQLTTKYIIPAEQMASVENQQLAIVNSHNFENVLSNTQLHQGVVITTDTLTELTADCTYLLVTEELTKDQWLRLLTRVAKLNSNLKIIDASNSTTAVIAKLMHRNLNNQLQCKTCQHKQDALDIQNSHSLIYQVTAKTNWLEMWQTINLTSQENFTFSVEDTELLVAIKQGKPIVFYGLATNPEILKYFESLLISPSYLLLNGNKITLDTTNITILLPENINQAKLPKLWQTIPQQQINNTTTEENEATEFVDKMLQKFAENNIKLVPDKKTIHNMFVKQLAIEQQQDQAEELLPIHYRKAAHTVFAKQYRDKPALYGYLKTQIESMAADNFYQQQVDAEAIYNWLRQNPQANRNSLAKNFWLLARHCSTSCFLYVERDIESFKFAEVTDDALLDKLANIILAIIPYSEHQHFARQFGITKYDDNAECLYCYNGTVVSAITNTMLIAKDQLKIIDDISSTAKELSIIVYDIVQQYPQDLATAEVYQLLLKIFSENILQTEFNDLASALVASQVDVHRKQVRKKQRLADRIKQHPIIFLQGIAGAGKSHMAKAVVNNLKKSGFENMPEPLVLSLGPETTASDLFGAQQLKQTNNDAHTDFVIGPVLTWAMSDNPPLLILDEANLVTEGVLAPLAGLTNKPPQLTYAGKVYPLSAKHRIILTGNPSSYDGRRMDTAISASMLSLHYKAMTDNDLTELIIKPALKTDLPIAIKTAITDSTAYLYKKYSTSIANDLGTRDLQDILARINRIIDHHGTNITLAQVYALVWGAFTEILASSITNKTEYQQIFTNYKTKFAINKIDNSILTARNEKFSTFFEQLVADNLALDLSSKSVKQLVKDYWLFLDSQASLQGRRGLWVEGPAGWGKDSILNAVLMLWEQQQGCKNKFIHVNANPNQYDKLQDTVKFAMGNGVKLVISELNLLPSRYLEGLFNQILTEQTNLGFMLFATVNPSSYGSREKLAQSFMNRMTQVKLAPISYNELHKLLLRRYPINKTMVDWLFSNYLDLDKRLKQQQTPIQLSLANLLETATKLNNSEANHWLEIFQQDYGIATLMIKDKTAELVNNTTQQPNVITQDTQDAKNNKVDNNIPYGIERFDNITAAVDLYSTKYFASNQFHTAIYRLHLIKPTVTQEGVKQRYLNIANKRIKIIPAPKLSDMSILKLDSEQLLGTAELKLYTDTWTALPGISYNDECIGISHTDLIELGRCPITRMLVVKLKAVRDSNQTIKLDFIIKPHLITLDEAKVVDNIVAPHQDAYLKQLLDDKIFSSDVIVNNSIKKLQQIKLITNKKQQIKELAIWASAFTDYMDITSTGADALIDAIFYQTGTCKHRSIAFQILAEYFGIPTNCVSSNIHLFVEVSLDNQQTWVNINLGGADNPDDKQHIKEQSFLDHQQDKDIGISTNQYNDVDNHAVYMQKKEDLRTQPNQFIRFLNFLANNPSYCIEEKINLFMGDFSLYINSTTAIFNEVLPSIFNTMITNIRKNNSLHEKNFLEFIYRFFANTYKQLQQGKITNTTAESILSTCLPLLEENVLRTGSLLGIVEYLAHNTKFQDKAEKILTEYYASFNKDITLNPALANSISQKNNNITSKSQVLAMFLKQIAIKTDWSYTSTGKSPNIHKLALRKPAFPINKQQQNNQKNIYIYLAGADYYRYLCDAVLADIRKQETNIKIDEFYEILPAFFNWLFNQMSGFRVNFLVDDNTLNTNIISRLKLGTIGCISSDSGIFTTDFYAEMFFYGKQQYDFIIGYKVLFSDLNLDRIKQVFGDSAILITQDIIVECFKEYLSLSIDEYNKQNKIIL